MYEPQECYSFEFTRCLGGKKVGVSLFRGSYLGDEILTIWCCVSKDISFYFCRQQKCDYLHLTVIELTHALLFMAFDLKVQHCPVQFKIEQDMLKLKSNFYETNKNIFFSKNWKCCLQQTMHQDIN